MAEDCLIRIEFLQNLIVQFDETVKHLKEREEFAQIDTGNIRERLFKEELDEWRNLFMWAITLEENEKERIKAAAYDRFLSKKRCVAKHLNNGIPPSRWLSSSEEEFRRIVEQHFLPDQK